MRNMIQSILMAIMTLAFPVSLVVEMIQLSTGAKEEGSMLANVFYLLTWCCFMLVLAWLARRDDPMFSRPEDERRQPWNKRNLLQRFLFENLRHRVNDHPGDPGSGALHH